MFEAGVSLFPIRCDKPTIHKVVNQIQGTFLVLWLKQFPLDPQVFVCKTELKTTMVVPTIQETTDLFGTHLECRIMRSHSDCWCRVLLWLEEDRWLCAASPNDANRDIDNMSFDLSTSKRKLPAQPTITLTFHQQLTHLFVDIGDQTIPIESIY